MLEDQVTIPPRSSVIISVGTLKLADLKGIVEGDQQQLINREICVARGIAELRGGKATVMLTNFSNEYKHVNKGTAVAYIEETVEATSAFALTYSTEPTPTNRAPQPAFDVNPSLPQHKQEQLRTLFLPYED